MKRTLSLVLALVMVLGSFTTVFAAVEVDTAADFLADEGILKGADGDLMLDNNLERRDAVILLSRLLDAEEIAEDFEVTEENPTWEDVRTDAYYVPFFAWAQENGYFEGDDEGNFNPRNAITAPEYSLVLLRALGYEVNGHESWKASLETAEKIGLLEGVEVEFADLVVRGEMAVMTYNALNAKMNGTDETLAEFLGIEMPEEPKAEKLEVVEVYTENLAEVIVELSNADLVENTRELENADNYRINSTGVEVYSAKLDGDTVVLTLVPYGLVENQEGLNSLIKGRDYKLTIRNVDTKINKTFDFTAVDNGIPAIESVEFIGTHGIKVTTSEPVLNPQERNFRVEDRRTSMIIEQYGRELILTPYHNASFDKDATDLVIEGLVDFAGYKSIKETVEMELDTNPAAPEVKVAYRNGNKLTVVFEEDIYMDSVSGRVNRRDLGNVSFEERRVTFTADTGKKVDTNVAVYVFEREIPKDALIVIEGVQNHSKDTMETVEVGTELFVDEKAPVVISDLETSVRTIGDEAKGEITNSTKGLKLIFDKHIKELRDENVDLSRHFTLYEIEVSSRGDVSKEVKINVEKIEDDAITLNFENIHVNNKNRDYDYVLEVRNFTDLSGNRMEREYVDFQVLEAATAFNVEKVSYANGSSRDYFNREAVEITVRFNSAVDKASAEDELNYLLDGELDVDVAIVERDGKTVTLVIYDIIAREFEYEILDILPRVKSLDKKSTVADRFWDLETGKAVEAPVVEEPGEEPGEEPEEPEVPGEDAIKATATSQSALGATKLVITVEGATGEEVEKVLVNGSEIAIQRVEGNDVTVLSASAVETVKIVVAGVEYSVTVTE